MAVLIIEGGYGVSIGVIGSFAITFSTLPRAGVSTTAHQSLKLWLDWKAACHVKSRKFLLESGHCISHHSCIVDAHLNLTEAESAALNAALVLLLANHIGDMQVLAAAVKLAHQQLEANIQSALPFNESQRLPDQHSQIHSA
jgi:hypothetical protein